MALLEILHHPDSRLRKKATPVTEVNDAVRKILDDMRETMYASKGIGLAATQVNIQKRMVVIDLSEQHDEPLFLINAEIIEKSGSAETEEGCLSVPEYYDKVTRAEKIKVRALDRDGKPFELEADGLLGVCIQHELDHLDGKLFVDYLSSLKQQRVRKKMEKIQRQQASAPAPKQASAG